MSGFNFGITTAFLGTQGFASLGSLEEVDLSYVKGTENLTNTSELFLNTSSLKRIYVSASFDLSNATNSVDMFKGCTSLVGQAPNTSYAFDSNDAVDKTYAKIATDDAKGYFTDISLKPTN